MINIKSIKQKILHELQRYLMYTVFLLILFFAFTSYERVLLGQLDFNYFPYGFCIIKALIMAKVIMVGEALNLGEKYATQPLIVPVIYKTILFCLFMLLLSIAEELIKGFFIAGQSLEQIYDVFISKHLSVALARIIIMFFIFIFFFSVMETSRALGGNKLFDMFFKRS
jgi:hypothetical protein